MNGTLTAFSRALHANGLQFERFQSLPEGDVSIEPMVSGADGTLRTTTRATWLRVVTVTDAA